MKDAKELFEIALRAHRSLERLTLIEKGAAIAIVNSLFQAEIQEMRDAIVMERRSKLPHPIDSIVPVDDEYQQ